MRACGVQGGWTEEGGIIGRRWWRRRRACCLRQMRRSRCPQRALIGAISGSLPVAISAGPVAPWPRPAATCRSCAEGSAGANAAAIWFAVASVSSGVDAGDMSIDTSPPVA